MFTFGADGRPRGSWAAGGCLWERLERCWSVPGVGSGRGTGWFGAGRIAAWWRMLGGLSSLARRRALGRRGGGADEILGGLSAAFALFGRETSRGSLLVGGFAGGERVDHADVAGDQRGGGGRQIGL
jgi:hypothetical protein